MIELHDDCAPACVVLTKGLPGSFAPTHAAGCVHRRREGRAWCETCRRMRAIEETSIESAMRAAGEVEYHATRFECGHSSYGPEKVVAVAPGEPYAGTMGFRTLRGFARRALRHSAVEL